MPAADDKPHDKKKAAAPATKKPAPAREASAEARAGHAGAAEPTAVSEAVPVAEPPADTGAAGVPAAGDAAKPAAAESDHIVHARRFLVLSIVNWGIAIVCWGISSYLGATRPASMFTYTILFVIAIVAVLVGCLCWLVYRFAHPVPEETTGGAR
jgi:hypothetical protein